MRPLLQHVLRRSLRSLRENLGLNLVSTGVIAAAMMLMGLTLVVVGNLSRVVETWDRDVHLSAYFFADVPEARRLELRDAVAARPEVQEVRYVSEAEAGAWLREVVPEIRPVLDELGDSVLPSSLEVLLLPQHTGPGQVEAFARSLGDADFTEVDHGQEWVQRFNAFLSLLRVLGVALGSLVLTATVFLVANAMHLVVYARREELETMKLVGATWGFIVAPFLIEGAVQGLVGGGLALGALYALHGVLVNRLGEALQVALSDTPLVFLPIGQVVGLLLVSVALGTLGCFTASRRFWRVAP